MAIIEKFLGQRVEIPENCRYDVKQGLWGRGFDETFVFGLTEPALVLSGGVKDVEWLVDDGQTIRKGEAILFAITSKILYIDAPIAGSVQFNEDIQKNAASIMADPYHDGWLFLIEPKDEFDQAYLTLSSPQDYLDKLRLSEGFKNPDGLKGGVSGICKAVYSGIGEQKI